MATIKLFVSNSMRGVMDELLPQFEHASGNKVEISYDPAKLMMERIRRGEAADLVIIGGSAVEELEKTGKIAAGSRRVISSCGVGIAVKAGAPKPDIGSVDSFKRALLAARSVAYTEHGASGIYFSGLIEKLGIAAEVKAKAARQAGGLVGEIVAAGKAELAVQQIPELMVVKGVDFVGPLPKEIQQTTVSSIGIFAGSRVPKEARALYDFLTTADAGRVIKAKGHEPASGA
jgi:molybdate transport system substrate-binding protein